MARILLDMGKPKKPWYRVAGVEVEVGGSQPLGAG